MSEQNESKVMAFYDGEEDCSEDCSKVDDILSMIRARSEKNKKRDMATGEDVLTMVRNRVAARDAAEVDVPEETNNLEVKAWNIGDLRKLFQAAE